MASARPPRGSVSLPFQSWQDTKLPRGAPDPWASWGQGALLGQLEKGTDGLGLSSAEQWLPLGYKCPFLAKGLGRAWTPWGGEGASCGLFCRAGISSTTQHADPTLEHNTPQSASYSRDKEGRTAAPLSQEGLAPQPAAAGQLTGWLPAPQSSAPLWPWGLRFGSPAPAGQGLAAALGSRLVLDPGSGVPGRPMCCPVGGRTIRRHCLQAWAFTPRALSQPGPQKWPCGSSRSGAGSGEAGAGRGDQIRRGLRTGALSPPRAVFCGAGPHSLQVSAPLSALCCCVSLAPKERLHRGQKRPAAQPRLDFRRSLGGAGGGGGLCPQAVRVPQGGVRPALPDLVPSRVCPQAVAGCVGRTVSPVSPPHIPPSRAGGSIPPLLLPARSWWYRVCFFARPGMSRCLVRGGC